MNAFRQGTDVQSPMHVNERRDAIIVATAGPTLNRDRAQVQCLGQILAKPRAKPWPGRK